MFNIVDDFVDRLADDIGVSLSLSGEPSPLIDRFVNACLSDEDGKWITIGGKSEGDKGKHVGGFRVQINGDGKIIKGRLKGTNVKDVKKRFDEGKNRGTPIRDKQETSNIPHFMKNVKNTVDNSRKDANIEGTAAKETAGNDDAKGTKMETANMTPNQEIKFRQDKSYGEIMKSLPKLEGSEKQVSWANKIRDTKLEHLTRNIVSREMQLVTITSENQRKRYDVRVSQLKKTLSDVLSKTAAKFWIDSRDSDLTAEPEENY